MSDEQPVTYSKQRKRRLASQARHRLGAQKGLTAVAFMWSERAARASAKGLAASGREQGEELHAEEGSVQGRVSL